MRYLILAFLLAVGLLIGCISVDDTTGPDGWAPAAEPAPLDSDIAALPSMEVWQSVEQTEQIIEFFRDLFSVIGVRVIDTDEAFSAVHRGDVIGFVEGIDADAVDYVVEIERFQIERLATYGFQGDIAPDEQFRVMKEVFTPATATLLKNESLARPMVKRLTGAEDVMHVELVSPIANEEGVSHTIRYVNKSWEVTPGLSGEPDRLFELGVRDAIVFQKAAHRAANGGLLARWRFGRWYRKWRETVSSSI